MSEETTNTNIEGILIGHDVSDRAFRNYIGLPEHRWLEKYGAITVTALIGENQVRVPFKLQLESIELVTDGTQDGANRDTFDYRAVVREMSENLKGRSVSGRISMKSLAAKTVGSISVTS
jgi:hypothetical protein